MTMDPIGTPRRYGSLTSDNHSLLRDTSNGWNSLTGTRNSSAAATPVRTPVREVASIASAGNAHLSELWARYEFSRSQYTVQNKLLEVRWLLRSVDIFKSYDAVGNSTNTPTRRFYTAIRILSLNMKNFNGPRLQARQMDRHSSRCRVACKS